MRLRAVKPLTYATRRLVAGDVFETVRDRDARVLLATRKVEAVRAEVPVPPPPPEVKAKIEAAVAPDLSAPVPAEFVDAMRPEAIVAVNELAAARAAYESALGKKPFHGWDVETLRKKIAEKAGE